MCQVAEIPKYKTEVILTTSIDFKKVHIKKKKKKETYKSLLKKQQRFWSSLSLHPQHTGSW